MNYFIPYEAKAEINYVYLLCLYKIAEYNKSTKIRDTINYTSLKQLSALIKQKTGIEIKQTTLYNFINRQSGKGYFILYSEEKRISLQNNYNKNFRNNQIQSFVILDDRQIEAILKVNKQLFSKYLVYLVYHCNGGRSTNNTIDQFLSSAGYSANSSYISKVSEYNTFLVREGLIKIKRYRDQNGHTRNIYTLT